MRDDETVNVCVASAFPARFLNSTGPRGALRPRRLPSSLWRKIWKRAKNKLIYPDLSSWSVWPLPGQNILLNKISFSFSLKEFWTKRLRPGSDLKVWIIPHCHKKYLRPLQNPCVWVCAHVRGWVWEHPEETIQGFPSRANTDTACCPPRAKHCPPDKQWFFRALQKVSPHWDEI